MNRPVELAATTSVPFRFTVEQFLALCDRGLFQDYAKSELIEGEIVVMNAQHARHARIKTLLATRLNNALDAMGSELEAWAEPSVQLSDRSLPEPDIVITDYRGDHFVTLETAKLLIEVSDTTLGNDLGRKANLYAAAGVPEYWVVDVEDQRVLMHTNPRADGNGYDDRRDVPFGDTLHAATIEGLTVATGGL